jgi:VWFA-related protein
MRLFRNLALMAGMLSFTVFPSGSAVVRQTPVTPQDQRPGPPGTIRVRVRLIPVDVVVTDDRDRPITDLKQSDFQILENRRPQEIRHFSVQTCTASDVKAGAPSAIRLVPTLELAPQQARTFLILMGRGRHNQGLKAVDALIQFVRTRLLPQDRVAVYAYNRATDFTTDHEQIAQVLERYKQVSDKIESWIEGRTRGFSAVYGIRGLPKSLEPDVSRIFENASQLASRQVIPGRVTEEGKIVRDLDRAAGIILGQGDRAGETGLRLAAADETAVSGVQTAPTMQSLLGFDQLQADAITLSLPFDEFIPRAADSIEDMQNIFTCIEYLRYVEGDKHLLYFSGKGLLFPYGNEDYDKGIAAVANDARVAIDTFHTGGLAPTVMPTRGVELASTPRGSTTTAPPPPPPTGSLFNPADTAMGQSLRTISAITGGRTAIYQDIGKSLEIVNETTRVQYLLGYYPQDENWNGRYRQIQVKVNRPGVKVYSRRGYFARDQLQPYDKVEFLAFSRISAAASYGGTNHIDDVPFKLNTSKATDDQGQSMVQIDLKIDAAKVAFKTQNAMRSGRLRVAIFAGAISGAALGADWKTIDLQLKEDTYQEYLKSGIPFSTSMPLKMKSIFLKVIVYDYNGDRVGFRTIRFETLLPS